MVNFIVIVKVCQEKRYQQGAVHAYSTWFNKHTVHIGQLNLVMETPATLTNFNLYNKSGIRYVSVTYRHGLILTCIREKS